jgi:CheY-like chemotaxis protein
VAVEHLSALGFRAETVQNGAEAVVAVFAKEYAAVLMDCQMPIMDGYGATREIRRRETDGCRVPIIAVTAHALVGERDNVLAAGMDDYIPKPVNAAELERALLQWIGPSTRRTTAVNPAVAEPMQVPANDTLISVATLPDLEPNAALRPRLVELFLLYAPEQLVELLAQVRARDAERARAVAHKLKGGLYAVRGAPLADELETLRRELAAGAWDDVDVRLNQIEARLSALAMALQLAAANAQQQTRESTGSS